MGDHLRVPCFTAGLHRLQGLGDRADLVYLDQCSVADAVLDRVGDDVAVGDEDVVSDDLDAVTESLGELDPAVSVVFCQAVFDAPHRKERGHLGVPVDQVGC